MLGAPNDPELQHAGRLAPGVRPRERCGKFLARVLPESSVAMLPFETTSITVAYQQRCEDRVKVVELDGGLVIVVADGAGTDPPQADSSHYPDGSNRSLST